MAKSDVLIRMKADVSNYDANIAKARKQLDGFAKSNLTAGGQLKQFTSLLVSNAAKFASLGTAVSAAMKVVKDAFNQSESNIDEWGRTMEGAKAAYNIFLDTLNNGNWSNFFQNLQTAIQGGRDLYDVFDRLGSIKSNNAAAIAIVQQQIAQLRLAKQQGANVDAQIKAATERLAQLQKQSINAGKIAGTQLAFQVIRNGVNSIGGAGINDATINYAVQQIMKNGQSEFDKYARNVRLLEQRGTKTRNEWYTDNLGIARQRPVTDFQISNLSQAEQRQYALAKAITEGETRIQQGISAYAQAIQEGTLSAREELKGNRYAGIGSGKGGKNDIQEDVEETINKIVTSQWETASRKMESMADTLRGEYTGPSNVWKALTTGAKESTDSITRLIDALGTLNEAEGLPRDGVGKNEEEEKANLSDKLSDLSGYFGKFAGGLGSVSSGLKNIGIKLPEEVDAVIGVISGVAQVISGVGAIIELFSTTAETANTIATTANTIAIGGLIDALAVNSVTNLIPFLARGGVVHAAQGYVPGNNYSGDLVPAFLNSGELVLNKAQQGNLASQLQGNGINGMNIRGRIKGTDIILSVDRTLQLQGKQMLTWG